MSDKMRMQHVEKVQITPAIKVMTKVKLERVAKNTGLTFGTFVAAILDEHASKVPTLAEDLERANEIIAENIRKRDVKKQQKGVN